MSGQFMIYLCILGLLLSACVTQPSVTCNAPYILNGNECCLDKDANAVCDADEGKAGASEESCQQDCSLCPAKIVEREVPVTKYVCEKSGSLVAKPEDCVVKAIDLFKDYKFITTTEDEDENPIESFSLRPACRDSQHAVEIHYTLGTVADEFTVQVKETPDGQFRDVFTLAKPPADNAYYYGVFCTSKCTGNADFFLEPGKAYVLRGKYDHKRVLGLFYFTNEYFIDATSEGEYMTKLC